ncbi:hypothetical protein WM30_15355 [Burkholderia ubonensis]|nr:hypothetical protein WM30_15355 [Burkholderia ubonensis]
MHNKFSAHSEIKNRFTQFLDVSPSRNEAVEIVEHEISMFPKRIFTARLVQPLHTSDHQPVTTFLAFCFRVGQLIAEDHKLVYFYGNATLFCNRRNCNWQIVHFASAQPRLYSLAQAFETQSVEHSEREKQVDFFWRHTVIRHIRNTATSCKRQVERTSRTLSANDDARRTNEALGMAANNAV